MKEHENLLFCKSAFPVLQNRHRSQTEKKQESEILYYKQLHENYMYLFYSTLRLDVVTKVCIGNTKGVSLSTMNITNISLNPNKTAVLKSEEEFYSFLLKAPIPFVFIPEGSYEENISFVQGAVVFEANKNVGILMDVTYVSRLGLDFLLHDVITQKETPIAFLGFIITNSS